MWQLEPFVFNQQQNSLGVYFALRGKIDTTVLIRVTWRFSAGYRSRSWCFKILWSRSRSLKATSRSRNLKNVTSVSKVNWRVSRSACVFLKFFSIKSTAKPNTIEMFFMRTNLICRKALTSWTYEKLLFFYFMSGLIFEI